MEEERITKSLEIIYKEKIVQTLCKQFNFVNKHQVPKLIKIQINRGLGIDAQNTTILKKSIEEFRIITGQHPIVTKASKSIAAFKVRENMNLGVTVTLRREKMYSFLEKLIHLVLPRIRDFKGLSKKGFDRNGNFNFGLRDQLVFPEISYDMIDQTRGFNITIVTSSKTIEESCALLKEFGFPLTE
jgi:large subunit ribosomal protein L5